MAKNSFIDLDTQTPDIFTFDSLKAKRDAIYRQDLRLAADTSDSSVQEATFVSTLSTFTGTAGDDYIDGTIGDDHFYGSGGSDYISGGWGGEDTLDYRGLSVGVTVKWFTGATTVKGSGGTYLGEDEFYGMDNLYLTDQNDVVFLGDNKYGDKIWSLGGDDIFYSSVCSIEIHAGGEGARGDFISYRYSEAGVRVDLNTNQAYHLEYSGRFDWLYDIERVAGSEFSDEIYGGYAINNTLQGRDGDDILYGWGINDTLFGNEGDDYLYSSKGNDILVGGEGHDTFAFDVIDGKSYIPDFDPAVDSLEFLRFADKAAMLELAYEHTNTTNGITYTVIHDTNFGGKVTIAGLTLDQLTNDVDIVFGG